MSGNSPQFTDLAVEPISSGLDALDTLLDGGFVRGRTYLVQGIAGTGKSLLGQHFLRAGLDNDETVLYVHGEESRRDILVNAAQLGLDITDAEFLDIGPGTEFFAEDISYDLVDSTELESERFTKDVRRMIEDVDPSRVLIDPITQLKYVERDHHQYRKRLQSLIRFLRDRQVTTVATRTAREGGVSERTFDDFESLSDGVINLYLDESERRIAVPKHRGLGQRDGTHGLEIRENGLEIYPQVVPEHDDRVFDPELVSTGLDDLDDLLGGGIERGTVTMISGPSGIGKSTIGAQLLAGASAGDRSATGYLFEESVEQFTYRAENLGFPVSERRAEGDLQFTEIEPLDMSAEEFARDVLEQVAAHDPDVVLVDGLSGYEISLQGDSDRLVRRLHALTRVLKNRNVAVVITDETNHITGIPAATSTESSYLADNIVFLTYVEVDGELQRAICVLKKRIGDFDARFHRFSIDDDGLVIGTPFENVRGLASGTSVVGGEHP